MIRVRAIDLKLLRDLRRLWAQVLAIAVVLACGITVLLMSVGMSDALDRSRAAYYDKNAFGDVFARATRVPQTLLPEVRAIPGVRDLEGRVSRFVILDLPGRVRAATAQIVSLPEIGMPSVNRPILTMGRWPAPGAADEVLVNAPFAVAHGYRPGDSFAATLGGTRRQLTVVGAALSPEFIYTIGPGAMMPDPASHGIIWMPMRAAEAAFDMTGAVNDIVLTLSYEASPKQVFERLDYLLDPYGGVGAHGRDDQISHAFLDAEIEGLRVMAYILPPVFLVISVFLVNMVVGRIVALERSEIGLLKATGYSDHAILVHYLLFAALVALVGICMGFALGAWASREVAEIYARFYDFPELIFGMSWTTYALGALAGFGAAGTGAFRAALSAGQLPPAVAMAPPPPPVYSQGGIDRVLTRLRLPQTDMMILRSLTRWPLRAGTSVLGYALGTAVLVASNFAPNSMERLIEISFDLTNRQHVMLTFAQDVPVSTVEAARRLPGVLQAEGHQWLSATLRRDHNYEDVTLQGIDPKADLARILGPKGTVAPPEKGLLLTESLMPRLGLRLGDTVEVKLTGRLEEPVMLTVVGTVPQYLGPMGYMAADEVDRILGRAPRVSSINLTLRADMESDFHAAIKQAPGLGGAILLADNRDAFEETIAANMGVMSLIYVLLGGAIAVGVAYNGARIQLSERARELASLRILGFGRWEVSWVLIGETMLLAVLAQPLGWWIGAQIAALITSEFSSDLYTLPLILKPSTYAQSSIVTLTAALGAVFIVRRRTDRLDLVAVMKTRE